MESGRFHIFNSRGFASMPVIPVRTFVPENGIETLKWERHKRSNVAGRERPTGTM